MYLFFKKHVSHILITQKLNCLLAFFLITLSVALEVFGIELFRTAVNAIEKNIDTTKNFSEFGNFLGSFGINDSKTVFIYCSILVLILPLLSGLVKFFQFYIFEMLAVKVTMFLRRDLFEKTFSMPLLTYKEFSPGTLIKRISEDSKLMRQVILDAGLMRLVDILMVLGLFIYGFQISVKMTFVTLFCCLFYFTGAYFSAKISRGKLRRADESFEAVVTFLEQALNRFVDIKVNENTSVESKRFLNYCEVNAQKTIGAIKFLLLDRSLTSFLSALGPAIVLIVGGYSVLNGEMNIGSLLAFLSLLAALYGPVNDLSAIPLLLVRSGVSLSNLEEIFSSISETNENNKIIFENDKNIKIEFKDFFYLYPNSENGIYIKDLTLKTGDKIVLVGASGVGKSTFFGNIFKLFDGYQGSCTINDQELPYK